LLTHPDLFDVELYAGVRGDYDADRRTAGSEDVFADDGLAR
jgi:hypothetical protein